MVDSIEEYSSHLWSSADVVKGCRAALSSIIPSELRRSNHYGAKQRKRGPLSGSEEMIGRQEVIVRVEVMRSRSKRVIWPMGSVHMDDKHEFYGTLLRYESYAQAEPR